MRVSESRNISTSTIASMRVCGSRIPPLHTDPTQTWDVLHKYPHNYKVVFVGDASMSPYEIMVPGGSVEHVNEEAGAVWLDRITRTYPHAGWLNPVGQKHWDYS